MKQTTAPPAAFRTGRNLALTGLNRQRGLDFPAMPGSVGGDGLSAPERSDPPVELRCRAINASSHPRSSGVALEACAIARVVLAKRACRSGLCSKIFEAAPT